VKNFVVEIVVFARESYEFVKILINVKKIDGKTLQKR